MFAGYSEADISLDITFFDEICINIGLSWKIKVYKVLQ